jgi:hypothetical protein
MSEATRPGRLFRAVLCAVVAALIALACGACGSSGTGTLAAAVSSSTTTTTSTNPLSVTAGRGTTKVTGPTLSTPAGETAAVRAGADAAVAPTSKKQGFLGIATELSTVTSLSGTPADPDTPLVTLLKNLSPGAPFLLRMGGDSADWSWWAVPGMKKPAAIRYTVTPQWGADVKALLTSLGGKSLIGVNLELDNKRVTAYEVKEFDKYVGADLIDGFEVGNEPELYGAFNYYKLPNGTGVKGRVPGHYTLADYGRDYTNIASDLGSVPIVGPASGSPTWLPDLGMMLEDLPSRMKLVTVHQYPEKRCSATTVIPESGFFTFESIQGLAANIAAMVQTAAAQGKPLRVDEINGISCGGQAGVSNSFGEALWALNVLPELWAAGVQGVNFQTIDGNLNQLISAQKTGSKWNVSVEPEYYGLLTFADVAPAGSHLLKISDPGYAGFYEFASRSPDGETHVVLTNVSSSARTVGVSAAGARGTGTVARLTAGSLTATSGETLAGQHLSSSAGALTGATRYTLVKPNAKRVYAVKVPAHSAAILTVGS